MADSDQPLASLKRGMCKLPQTLRNVRVAEPSRRAASRDVLCAVDEKAAILEGRGRVLIRPSGTEPVVRVMVEGEQAEEVAAIADELAEIVGTPARLD